MGGDERRETQISTEKRSEEKVRGDQGRSEERRGRGSGGGTGRGRAKRRGRYEQINTDGKRREAKRAGEHIKETMRGEKDR